MKAIGIYLQPKWANRPQVYTYHIKNGTWKTRVYNPTNASRDRLAKLTMKASNEGRLHIHGCAQFGKLGNITIHDR